MPVLSAPVLPLMRWRRLRGALALAVLLGTTVAGLAANQAAPVLTLDGLPRPATPPPEAGPVVPSQVARWRDEAKTYEHGDGVERDPLRAAQLYCRAARHGDPEAQYSLAWMLTNARGIERDDAQAAHLFAAAAEQGMEQARNMARRMGTPRGPVPACLRQPETDPVVASASPAPPAVAAAAAAPAVPRLPARPAGPPGSMQAILASLPPPPLPAHAPEPIVRFVKLVAPEYQLEPHLVLAVMAAESNFDPLAESPKKAQGLMQLIPDTAVRFGVRNALDPTQNIRGGMAYLRWLLAYFEGDVQLALAAYNAGEGAVERYRGVPPYAETRAYVRKILGAIGYRLTHPFDPKVTEPSPVFRSGRTLAASAR